MGQSIGDDGSPSGLEEGDQRVLLAAPLERRKLTSHEWTITNEKSSLLDIVSEASTRMQGAEDTHVSQATFIIIEVIELLKEDSHPIRVANCRPYRTASPQSTSAADLTLKA